MQLDAGTGLENQLKKVTGSSLEDLVAATLAFLGYTVLPDLVIEIDGDIICQIDVFASLQTPFQESRLVFECKGGHPSFEDIRSFASLQKILNPPPTKSIMVCKQGTKENRKQLAEQLGLQILERQDLSRWILPLLSGAAQRPERVSSLNRWITVFEISRYLSSKSTKNKWSKAHLRFISHELWWITDPIKQARDSLAAATKQYKYTSLTVAEDIGVSLPDCLAHASSDIVEGAIHVEMLHRLVNMYAITRSALRMQSELGRESLLQECGVYLQRAINKITENPGILFGFPRFFQYWLCIWGGVLRKATRQDEIGRMATECSTTPEAIESYLDIVSKVYKKGARAGMFQVLEDKEFFKYVPAAYRALGLLHRRKAGLMDEDDAADCLFSAHEDTSYLEALNRALQSSGGIASLRW